MQEKKYNDAKKEIRSVLLTYQKGVSLDEFLKSYRGLVGERLPSRTLGFTSDIEFLRSMPDVVLISTNDVGKICLIGVADKASQHIQKLVSKQRTQKPNNKSRKSARQPFKPTNSYKTQPFVPGPLRAEMIQVAAMYPDGITLPSFVLAYVRKFNKYLTLERGLVSLESMVNVISDLEIRTVRSEKKIFCKSIEKKSISVKVLKPEAKNVSSPATEGNKSQEIDKTSNSITVDSSGIPETIQKNFIKVLEKCPEGILDVHFPPLYENVAGQPFDILDLGYNSLFDLVDALPSIFKRVLDPNDGKCWILLPAKASTKHYSTSKNTANHKKSSPVKHREGIPADAASPLMQFNPPLLPKNINLHEFLPVFVSAIVNPWLFWFQLQLNENIAEFEALESDIGSFYGSYTSYNYKMHDADIFIGATCIVQCPDDRLWYRAVIKAIPTTQLVNVLFIDYGSRDNVPRECLRYARSKYMDFPAHAFRAELAGVKPARDDVHWDSRSSDKFVELCSCATLMANLIPIGEDVFSVYLCDTSGDCDIHINDTLVKEGYADLCFEKNETSRSDSFNELSNSELSSGVSDSDVHSTPSFCDKVYHAVDVSATNYKDLSPSKLEKQSSSSDSSSLPVNRKLDFTIESKSNGTEAKSYSKSNGTEAKSYSKSYGTEAKSSIVLSKCSSQRYIKRVKDYDYLFHIIKHGNDPLISAGDVSMLLWKDDNPSYIIQRLMDKEIIFPVVVLTKEDNSELFRQCEWYKLVDLKSSDSSLNLYTLENALKILKIFGHPSLSIKHAIDGEIREFDPHHSFWQEFSYDDWEDIEKDLESENLSSLCLTDLKAKSQVLKMKRLKLLKVNNASCTAEIKRVDHLLFIIGKRMDYIAALWSES